MQALKRLASRVIGMNNESRADREVVRSLDALTAEVMSIGRQRIALEPGLGELLLEALTPRLHAISGIILDVIMTESSGQRAVGYLIESGGWNMCPCLCGAKHQALISSDIRIVTAELVIDLPMGFATASSCPGHRTLN